MLVCMGVALWFGEDDILLFASSALITIFVGVVLRFFGRDADNGFSRRDSYLLVTLVWIVYSLFATLPFILGGYIHSFTDAYFEAMSGFTTTGATIIDDVEALPHGILFWRSLTQWVGGLGIVFTVIAFIPSMAGSSGSIRVFGAESTDRSSRSSSQGSPRVFVSSGWYISSSAFGASPATWCLA